MKIHASLALALTVLAASASAGQTIQNGDFGVTAGTLDHWVHSGSISDSNGTTAHDFLTTTSQHSHSTRFAADMNVQNSSSSTFHSQMTQTFSPVPGSGVSEMSLWAYSFEQDLNVEFLYTDGTHNTIQKHFTGAQNEAIDGGWRKWDFLGGLDATKGLRGITISADGGGFNDTNNILVDDVSIQAVPEPASLVALALGGLGLLRRKRA